MYGMLVFLLQRVVMHLMFKSNSVREENSQFLFILLISSSLCSLSADYDFPLQNEDRTLWKLGTLPPGLITFYNLTYPLDRSWHVLGLGYDPALNKTAIENGAVVHYNGNYKPWLDLAIAKYKSYWSRYVMFNNSYLQLCNISE